MGKSANQKRKILLLERMLEQTDAEHPVNMKQMIDYLAEQEILAERKSIYADLAELRAVGMEISFRKAAPMGYYVAKSPMTSETAAKETVASEIAANEAVASEEAVNDETAKEETEEKEELYAVRDCERGETVEIYLRVKRSALPQLRARYGKDLTLLDEEEKYVIAVVREVADREFWGWLVSNGSSIRPQKPKEVVKDYKKALKKILEAMK